MQIPSFRIKLTLHGLTQTEIAFQQLYVKECNFELAMKPPIALCGLLENNLFT